MTIPVEPSAPSGFLRKSTTKATDHELQKYDNFTRYAHVKSPGCRCAHAGYGCGALCPGSSVPIVEPSFCCADLVRLCSVSGTRRSAKPAMNPQTIDFA